MGNVINLNRARKRMAREQKARQAASNRVEHGMTRAEREQRARQRALEVKKIDGHKLEE